MRDMRNVDPARVSELLNFFNELDNERQLKLITHAFKLSIEQNVEKEIQEKSGRKPCGAELERTTNERTSDIIRFTKSLYALDETGLAAVAMMMEELQPTSMTTEHDTVVTTTHTRQNLGTKLKETFPNADLVEAQSVVAKFTKKVKEES